MQIKNKRDLIIQEVIRQIKKELQLLKTSRNYSVIASQEAPSRMEARYDTRKEDMARLAEAQDQLVLETEELITELKTGQIKLVNHDQKSYLLVSKFGGKKFITKQGIITLVSKDSPLGKKFVQFRDV